MSYLPELPPVVPPPRQMVRDTDWAEFVKRYISDHSQFRDSLRLWIVGTNTAIDECCSSTGGVWDLGSVTEAVDGIFDFGSV